VPFQDRANAIELDPSLNLPTLRQEPLDWQDVPALDSFGDGTTEFDQVAPFANETKR
jgi:hypothetical protein